MQRRFQIGSQFHCSNQLESVQSIVLYHVSIMQAMVLAAPTDAAVGRQVVQWRLRVQGHPPSARPVGFDWTRDESNLFVHSTLYELCFTVQWKKEREVALFFVCWNLKDIQIAL